jgi:hypothetical protein
MMEQPAFIVLVFLVLPKSNMLNLSQHILRKTKTENNIHAFPCTNGHTCAVRVRGLLTSATISVKTHQTMHFED